MIKLVYLANLRIPTEKAYGIQITKMCEAFADSGLAVTLLVPFRKNQIHDDLFKYYGVSKNFKFKKIWAPDFYLPDWWDKPVVVVKNFLSAIILVIYALFSEADVFYSRDEGLIYILSYFVKSEKIIFEAHKFSENKSFLYNRFKKIGLKIVVVSNGLKNNFIAIGLDSQKIIVAADGVDLKETDINLSPREARKMTNLPNDKKIILYAGHLFDWKGVDTMAEAARLLPECLLVFVGGTARDVEGFKSKHKNVANLLTIGHKPHGQIPLYLKSADVLILPNSAKEKLSNTYTSPLKMFEYMAAKRPIVASNLSSIKEVLNEDNSVLFESNNSEALAKAINKVISNNQLANRISDQAFLDVQNYSWQKRVENILKFINYETNM